MRLTVLVFIAAASTAAAQERQPDDRRIVVRTEVRDVLRTERAVRIKEAAHAYQGRNNGPEQTERFSRKIKLGRDGRVSVANIAGDIVVTTGSGDEVSIEAVKRTRGDRDERGGVHSLVDAGPGRVAVRTDHDSNRSRDRRSDGVSVDYTVVIPATASIDVHSVSGDVKVTGVRGAVRAESVSGEVVATDTPKIELAKSVSGDVTLSGVSTEGDLAAASVSGSVSAKSVKVHALDLNSVSGSIAASDVTCDRLNAKSVSGDVEYTGAIARGGSYDINVHSGTVRLTLANPAGFVLNANTFSGSIRSDLPITIGGDTDRDQDRRGRRGPSNRTIRATYGDGSATLIVRSFSGDIIINKR
jgi:hypothetical protein